MDRFIIRRNLLRGSLSAPLVLTVSSAGAARTTFAVCFVDSEKTSASNLVPFTSADSWGDTWYRIAIPGKMETVNSTTNYYIQHPAAYGGGDRWYQASLTGGVFTLDSVLPDGSPEPGGTSIQVAALALFEPTDSSGIPTGIAFFDSQTGDITTKSCHCSVF